MTPKVIGISQSLLRDDARVKMICVGVNYGEHNREMGLEPPPEPISRLCSP